MTATAWFSMLARHSFAISASRLPLALSVSACAIVNSGFGLLQRLVFERRIAASVIDRPPIFIIGHWRAGTTYLHELLTVDPRFTAPTTLECFTPDHFLASGWLVRRLTFLLPAARPMDNVLVGWDRPQEDEFALLNSGLGSPYETIGFPNHRPVRREFLNLTEVAPAQLDIWKAGLLRFLQSVVFRTKRGRGRNSRSARLVLKSPPHTARLHVLRQLFPDAQFIHVVRDPNDLFSSTVRLWRILFDVQGWQSLDLGALSNGAPSLEDYVLDTMDLLYRDFFAQRTEIEPSNFCEVRYEDLVRAPVVELERIYDHLGLGEFDTVRPRHQANLVGGDPFRANDHRMSKQQKAEVGRRWHWYSEQFGYPALDEMRA
jgi:omega-hydroxy-beta-dihydromenaquinone-9 sulfotransferase